MKRRILCPWHKESTPSLVQSGGGWFCFGACHKRYTNEEVQGKTGINSVCTVAEAYEPEDIAEKFRYIKSLERREIRGLRLPADERGYFVCWPNDAYYKYRLFNSRGSKYIGPAGHSPPLFWAQKRGYEKLMLVEGEINALSAVESGVPYDVCSPGSASCFNTNFLTKYLPLFKQYSSIVVVLDDDAAGSNALIEAKAFFLYRVPFVSYLQMKNDCNEVLCDKGKEGLRKRLQG